MNRDLRNELRARVNEARRRELGLRIPELGTEAERQDAIRGLLEFVEREGRVPRAKHDLRANNGLPTDNQLVRIFGSVTEAYVAAGLPAPRRGDWRTGLIAAHGDVAAT